MLVRLPLALVSPASTVAFAQVLHEAGLPAGVFNVVTSSNASDSLNFGKDEHLARYDRYDNVVIVTILAASQLLDLVLGHVAVAAEDLHGLERDLGGGAGAVQLHGRGLGEREADAGSRVMAVVTVPS